MIAWILSLLIIAQPIAPWRDNYENVARGIASAVEENEPLFKGDNGREKTAALLVSLAWYESRFDVFATGDKGKSHGLYQQQRMGNLSDPKEATVVAIGQLRLSMRICRGRVTEELLGWYAAGGEGCDRGLRESRHRVMKAFWLLRNHPRIP